MVLLAEIQTAIQKLVEKYETFRIERGESGLKELSEANIRKDFIDPLFEALGWKTDDSHEYDAESYIRGAGFADIVIKLHDKPMMFIEAKRFGQVPSRTDRGIQTTITGYKIYADWTAEERQVLNYAGMSLDVKWAVLTNFEKFRLFNAKTGDTIINIEKPAEYKDRIDDLLFLSKRSIESGTIDRLETRIERKDVDLDFLNALNHWRLVLANEIFREFPNLELETIKPVVQRILDRLVIIRYAEDRWVLSDPDQLKAVYEYWKRTRTYTKIHEILYSLFAGFNSIHDSRIFENDELVDTVLEKVNPELLGEIINQLYNQSFRKFTSDILGNTYESYLGHELNIKNGILELRPNEQVRKAGGIYYTPSHVVSFIVKNTVQIELEKIWKQVAELFEDGEYANGEGMFERIFDLKVLDEACGSGSFLIKTLDVFKSYCEKYNALVEDANKKINERIIEMRKRNANKEAWELESRRPNRLVNYETRILNNCIYGVDIDAAAAEIASVNLILQALKRGEKLPLILYENIKVGNSLVWDKNEELKKYFSRPELKRPFNWDEEFKTILANRRFDCVIGNPPYITMEKLPEEQTFFQKQYPQIYAGKNDLLYYFMFKGITLLQHGGRLGFIVSRYFADAAYASKLRKFLLESVAIETIIDFGNIQIFEKVNVLTLIVILRKEDDLEKRSNNNIKIVRVRKWDRQTFMLLEHIKNSFSLDIYQDDYLEIFLFPQSALTEAPWNITNPIFSNIIKKMRSNAWLLGDLGDIEQSQKTGLNEVFCVDSQTIAKWHLEKDLLRRVIKNSDVKKYYIDWIDGFLIYTTDSIELDKYPNTKKYLSQFKEKLQARSECKDGLYPWWRLQRPRRESIFGAPEKIIVPFLSTENRFGYDYREDGKGYYGTADTYVMVPFESCNIDTKFILAILNSKCMEFYHKNTAKLKRDEYYEYLREPLKKLPIAKIDIGSILYAQIVKNTRYIVELKKAYYHSIHTFENMIRNYSNQNTSYETLNDYVLQTDAYQIDLAHSRKFIDNTVVGNITDIKTSVNEHSLILTANYATNVENIGDIIHISINDRRILDYLYYCTKIFLVKNYKKRNWGTGNVTDVVLKAIQIPRFVTNINMNKQRIIELIEEFYKISPIGKENLSTIESKMTATQEQIDEEIYKCYNLSQIEIDVIEKFIADQSSEVSRTF